MTYASMTTARNAVEAGWTTPGTIFETGTVTGSQNLVDIADPPSDPFWGTNLCSAYDKPHCQHHGSVGEDPYPSEDSEGCPPETEDTPPGPTECEATCTSFCDFKKTASCSHFRTTFQPTDLPTDRLTDRPANRERERIERASDRAKAIMRR